jgi:hypothetical protein
MLRRLKRLIGWAALTFVAAALLVYGGDFAVFRVRAATNRNAYGTVTVSHYYAVLHKNGKTEFIFDPPKPESCVHALFPHGGLAACWYLAGHPEQQTDI